jgi:heavy metal sensor kinase
MIKSIRLRFIFWYTVILALTFSLFAVVLYIHVSDSLKSELDDVLLTKAEGIARSINTYWEIEKIDALRHGAKKTIFTKINNLNFNKIARRWVEERSNDPELMDIIVQIYNPEGRVIANSPNAPARLDISRGTLKSLMVRKAYYEDRQVPVEEDETMDLRIIQVPVFEEGRIAYIVQAASPLSSYLAAMNRLMLILFLLLPITVIAAGILAGEFLASITLKPLKKMIGTVRQITAENMSLRIETPESKDEIRQLAETFNDMLQKIQQVLVSQRQFIQDVSHELRTPLTIMRGELEVALKRQRTTDEYHAILLSILDESKKVGKLLEDLLTLARYDSSSASLAREQTDISLAVEEIIEDMQTLAFQKGITIELVCQDGVVIPIDRPKLMRSFINILDNAIKYTPENGRISVEVIQVDSAVAITITDTGIGIPEADLPHIFDRFYQVDKSRSSAGFGLGLSISSSIIEAHGGTVTVRSREGEGTSFLISLPLGPAPALPAHAATS